MSVVHSRRLRTALPGRGAVHRGGVILAAADVQQSASPPTRSGRNASDSLIATENHTDPSVMKLQIRVGEDGTIEDVKFKTFGCGSAIASSSYMTERVKGLSLEEAGKVKNTEIAKELCLPPVKRELSKASKWRIGQLARCEARCHAHAHTSLQSEEGRGNDAWT